MVRKLLVWLHRWTGLLMAGFLIVEGVTGSLLAFRESLDRLSAPQLFATPRPGVAPLGLAALARRAEVLAPGARVGFFSLDDRQVVMHMLPRTSGEEPAALGFDRLFLDPWTGQEMGRRLDGDISQGWINLVPFIYRVHRNLAAGATGMWVLGLVALAWTVDSFIGLYLTLPVVLSRFLFRWKTAWLIKWRANAVRVNFDLHRASGLWLWPLFFVFAWSSVMFNLYNVYEPVTGALFDYHSGMDDLRMRMLHSSASSMPHLDWEAAQSAGEHLMALEAARRGLRIERPYGMAYIPELGVYTYAVAAKGNIQHDAWTTSLWLDSNTGALVKMDLPSGEHAGNTVENWLRALHFADLRDSLVYRVLVCALGLVVAALSVTGVYIWLKKRRARRFVRATISSGPYSVPSV
jgi:uncharacterized iron-regulated membrane protein